MSSSTKKCLIFFEFISFILIILSYLLYTIQSFVNQNFTKHKSKSALTEKLLYENFGEEIYSNIRSKAINKIQKRMALATALIQPCDLLILDEPTNHLDSETIGWLEEYLAHWKGALLTVTHDRYFLDRVTTGILEFDKGQTYNYDGNYSQFLEQKAARIEREEAGERKRQNFLRN